MENDTELAEGCRAGDNAARQKLYTLYARNMLAVCFRYTGEMEAAHDVLHDGFVKVFTHFTFRGECSLLTWLTKVMVTQSIDYLRSRQRLTILPTDSGDLPDCPDEPDRVDDDSRLTQEVLMGFVAELPDGCRTVFNLYVFEEKSHKEIARLLGIKEHSSTSQLHRAKVYLSRRIKEYLEECE